MKHLDIELFALVLFGFCTLTINSQWNSSHILPTVMIYRTPLAIQDKLFFGNEFGSQEVNILNVTDFSWTTLELPTATGLMSIASFKDKYVIFACGVDPDDTVYDNVLIYDIETKNTMSFDMSEPRYSASMVTIGNTIIIAGGKNQTDALDSLFLIDIGENPFETEIINGTIYGLRESKYRMSMFSIRGMVILAGGQDDYYAFKTVEKIELYPTPSFTTLAPLPFSTSNPASTTALDKYIFIAGGAVMGTYIPNDYLFFMDIDKPYTWNSTLSLSVARYGLVSTSVQELVFFAGGLTGDDTIPSSFSSVVDVYNIFTQKLTSTNLATPRAYLSAVSIGNQAFFVGGFYTDGTGTEMDIFTKACTEGVDPVCSDSVWCNGFEICSNGVCLQATQTPCQISSATCSNTCNELQQNCLAENGTSCSNTSVTSTCSSGKCDGLGECRLDCPKAPPSTDPSEGSIIDEGSDKEIKDKSINMAAVVVPIILVAICIAGAIVAFIYLRRRKSSKSMEMAQIETDANAIQGEPNREYDLLPVETIPTLMSSSTFKKDLFIPSNFEIDYSELKLECEIGSGAFGVVWKGKWREGAVAVKALKELSEVELKNFKAEISLMMNLRPHANVVQLLGVSTKPETPLCIITEYVAGGSLWSFLQSDQVLEPIVALKLARGIAAGMIHLHLENIIHRDLAARNILLTTNYEAKVSDFGLARITAEADQGSQTATAVGPLRWMSPESLVKKQYSVKSDVWSFGIVLIEIVTRRLPYYDEKDAVSAVTKLVLGTISPSIPESFLINPIYKGFAEILSMCIMKNPSDRPTMKQTAEMLDKLNL